MKKYAVVWSYPAYYAGTEIVEAETESDAKRKVEEIVHGNHKFPPLPGEFYFDVGPGKVETVRQHRRRRPKRIP